MRHIRSIKDRNKQQAPTVKLAGGPGSRVAASNGRQMTRAGAASLDAASTPQGVEPCGVFFGYVLDMFWDIVVMFLICF